MDLCHLALPSCFLRYSFTKAAIMQYYKSPAVLRIFELKQKIGSFCKYNFLALNVRWTGTRKRGCFSLLSCFSTTHPVLSYNDAHHRFPGTTLGAWGVCLYPEDQDGWVIVVWNSEKVLTLYLLGRVSPGRSLMDLA